MKEVAAKALLGALQRRRLVVRWITMDYPARQIRKSSPGRQII